MNFDADLYVVGATILPVLFIGVMLPGSTLSRLNIWTKQVRRYLQNRQWLYMPTKRIAAAKRREIQARAKRRASRLDVPLADAEAAIRRQWTGQDETALRLATKPAVLRRIGAGLLWLVLQFLVLALLLLFALGEIGAVLALDHRHATHIEHVVVVVAVMYLTILTAVVAFLTYVAQSSQRDESTEQHGVSERP